MCLDTLIHPDIFVRWRAFWFERTPCFSRKSTRSLSFRPLVISKGVDISSVVVIDLALSDHFCILFDLLITQKVQTTSFSVKKRYINEKTSAQFREAIAMLSTMSTESADGLLDHFNLRILNVIGSCCTDKNQEHLEQTENTMEKHHNGQKPEKRMQES